MWKFIKQELIALDDLLKVYFWVIGIPWLLQYFTVELLS